MILISDGHGNDGVFENDIKPVSIVLASVAHTFIAYQELRSYLLYSQCVWSFSIFLSAGFVESLVVLSRSFVVEDVAV